VAELAAATVRRMLACPHLQPWRPQRWLSPTRPRAAAVSATHAARIARSTRPVPADESVLSVAAHTALPPRPRRAPTRPAPPGHRGRRPWGSIAGRFIACAIMSAPSTVKTSAHGGCNRHALSARARLSTAHGCIRWHRGAASSNAHACVSRMLPRQRTSKRRSNRACVHGLRPRILSTGRRHPWRRVWPRSLPWPPHMGYSIGVHLSERQR
jgi:hypothetical protein